jgi:hypothetical protein
VHPHVRPPVGDVVGIHPEELRHVVLAQGPDLERDLRVRRVEGNVEVTREPVVGPVRPEPPAKLVAEDA